MHVMLIKKRLDWCFALGVVPTQICPLLTSSISVLSDSMKQLIINWAIFKKGSAETFKNGLSTSDCHNSSIK